MVRAAVMDAAVLENNCWPLPYRSKARANSGVVSFKFSLSLICFRRRAFPDVNLCDAITTIKHTHSVHSGVKQCSSKQPQVSLCEGGAVLLQFNLKFCLAGG